MRIAQEALEMEDMVTKILSVKEQREQLNESSKQPPLWDKLCMARNPAFGGVSTVSIGRVGSGKTSMLNHQVKHLLDGKKAEDEILWWYGREACQWQRLGADRCKILIDSNEIIEFREGSPKQPSGKRIELDYQAFNNFKELLELADPTKLNVVYQGMLKWPLFIHYIARRSWGWNALFMDEIEDLAPENAAGDAHKSNQAMADIFKDMRKNNISLYGNTQAYSDLSYMVRSKIVMWCVHVGATQIKNCPVYKRAIQALRMGYAWLWTGGQFEKITYPPYLMPVLSVKAKFITGGIRSIEWLRDTVKELDIKRAPYLARKYNINPEVMIELHSQGFNDSQIAKTLHVPRPLVVAKLRAAGKKSNFVQKTGPIPVYNPKDEPEVGAK